MIDTSFADELARRLGESPPQAAEPDPEPAPEPDVLPALTEPEPQAEPELPARASPAMVAGLIPYSQVARNPTIYLAREPIALPRAEVIVLAGPGGYGKGTALVDLAARVTRGELLLGGRPGSVLWVGYEDRQDQTMTWRLDAAGADSRFVFDLTDVPSHGTFGLDASGKTPGDAPFLAAKIDALAAAARKGDISGVPGEGMPVLVVIDPLFKAIRGGSIRLGDGPGRVLAMLDEIARTRGVTIICPHHMDKSGSKIAGGVGIVNGARLVYRVDREDAEAGTYVLRVEKTNGLDKAAASSARYQIVGAGKQAHVIWLPPQATSAEPQWRVEAMEILPPEAFEGAPVVEAEPERQAIAAPVAGPPPSPYTAESPVRDIYAEDDAVVEAEVVPPMIKVAFKKGGPEYTYAVDPDQPVEVGDRVAVDTPAKRKVYADVTQIGSDYTGTPNPILFVVGRPPASEAREVIAGNIAKLGGAK